jgi:hypothetical protein
VLIVSSIFKNSEDKTMQNKLRGRFLIFSFITVLMFFTGWGCDSGDFDDDDDDGFDVGPEDEPNFKAFGTGIEGDVSIGVEAIRDDREVDGNVVLFIGNDEFNVDISDAILSTDFGMGTPIPQTDPDQPFIICTPSFVRFIVDIDGSPATLRLNECEKDNPENPDFIENGVLVNPCTGEEVTDVEAFKGVCLPDEPGKDSIVLSEFNGNCAATDPCVVHIDVVIFVPLFNPDIDEDIDLDGIIDNII